MLQNVHIGCLDSDKKIMNKGSFHQFPPSFPHPMFGVVNIKMNIFNCLQGDLRFTDGGGGGMMGKTRERGSRMEFTVENGVLTAYRGSGSRVRIPEGVTAIGDRVFAEQAELASVTFPKSLRRIGREAFFRCVHLRWVLLPAQVEVIDDRAFYGCEHMMSVELPKGLKKIGREAFAYCRSLESVTLPEGVESVGEDAFGSCPKLRLQ